KEYLYHLNDALPLLAFLQMRESSQIHNSPFCASLNERTFFHASIIPVSYGVIEAYIYLSLMIVGTHSIIQADVEELLIFSKKC
ncbi:MAG: hypothetical protein KAW19_04380, partial [Candidatus Aminicenantes bacterium]|nr:hypothetical protein [Candidatus Aminicenantes bacterium]